MDVPTNTGTRGPAPANPGVLAAEEELTTRSTRCAIPATAAFPGSPARASW